MKPSPAVAVGALTTVLTLGHLTIASAAVPTDSGPVTIGNRTYFDDGTVEVEFPPGMLSLSECSSGEFCVWGQANYTGSFRFRTGSGVKSVGGTVGSFWNNRSTVADLYNNTSSSSTCYENGEMRASVSASYSSAQQVNLSSNANC